VNADPREWIDGYLDDALDADQQQALAEWLRASEENRLQFMRAVRHHQQLRQAVQAIAIGAMVERETAAPGAWRIGPWLGAAAAAAALVLAVSWFMMPGPDRHRDAVLTEVRLERSRGSMWQGDAPRADRPMIGGPWVLQSGTVELVYGTGDRVVLQGPAAFSVEADRSLHLKRGRLWARASAGFSVRTPDAVIVDQGTQFGVQADRSGSEVHVAEGRVEVTPGTAASGTVVLNADEAFRVNASQAEAIVFSASDFEHLRLALGGPPRSEFEHGVEGWRVIGRSQGPTWHGRGGASGSKDPDGHLRVVDVTGGYFQLQAPAKFLGDQSASFGKIFRFDLRTGRDETLLKPRDALSDLENRDLEIHGRSKKIGVPVWRPERFDRWTTYRLKLNAEGGWHRLDLPRNPLASDEDIREVLSDVRRVLIPAEFFGNVEVVDVDRVIFGEAAP